MGYREHLEKALIQYHKYHSILNTKYYDAGQLGIMRVSPSIVEDSFEVVWVETEPLPLEVALNKEERNEFLGCAVRTES